MAAVHPLLDEIRDLLAAPLAGSSADQLACHPAGDPSRWSAQQVVEHLIATWRMTAAGIEDRIRKARPLKTHRTLRQHALRILICELGYFPNGRSAPEAVRPAAQPPISGDQLIARVSEVLGTMDAMLARIEPEARDAPVLNQGLLGPLNVRQWRRFHRAHARHHVAQLERGIRAQ
jgi:DinB family protein